MPALIGDLRARGFAVDAGETEYFYTVLYRTLCGVVWSPPLAAPAGAPAVAPAAPVAAPADPAATQLRSRCVCARVQGARARAGSRAGVCSDTALCPLIFSFFLGIYVLWTHAQCLLDTCGL